MKTFSSNEIKSARTDYLLALELMEMRFAEKNTSVRETRALQALVTQSDDIVSILLNCGTQAQDFAAIANIKAIGRLVKTLQALAMKNSMLLDSMIFETLSTVFLDVENEKLCSSMSNKDLRAIRSQECRNEDTQAYLCARNAFKSASTASAQSSRNSRAVYDVLHAADVKRSELSWMIDSFAYRALRALFIDDSSEQTASEQIKTKRAKRAAKIAK